MSLTFFMQSLGARTSWADADIFFCDPSKAQAGDGCMIISPQLKAEVVAAGDKDGLLRLIAAKQALAEKALADYLAHTSPQDHKAYLDCYAQRSNEEVCGDTKLSEDSWKYFSNLDALSKQVDFLRRIKRRNGSMIFSSAEQDRIVQDYTAKVLTPFNTSPGGLTGDKPKDEEAKAKAGGSATVAGTPGGTKKSLTPGARQALAAAPGAPGGRPGGDPHGGINGTPDGDGSHAGVAPAPPPEPESKTPALDCEKFTGISCRGATDSHAVLNPEAPAMPQGLVDAKKVDDVTNGKVALEKEAAKTRLTAQVLGYLRQVYAMKLVSGRDAGSELREKLLQACGNPEMSSVISQLNLKSTGDESVLTQTAHTPEDQTLLDSELGSKKAAYYDALKTAAAEYRAREEAAKQHLSNFDEPLKELKPSGKWAYVPCLAPMGKIFTPAWQAMQIRASMRKCGVANTAFLGTGEFKDTATDHSVSELQNFCDSERSKAQADAVRMAQIISQYPELLEKVPASGGGAPVPFYADLGRHDLSVGKDADIRSLLASESKKDGMLDRTLKNVKRICDDPAAAGATVFADEGTTQSFFSCGMEKPKTLIADPVASTPDAALSPQCRAIRNWNSASIACSIRDDIRNSKTKDVLSLAGTLAETAMEVGGCYTLGAGLAAGAMRGGVAGMGKVILNGMTTFTKADVVGAGLGAGMELYGDSQAEKQADERAGKIIAGLATHEEMVEQANYKPSSAADLVSHIAQGFMAGKALSGHDPTVAPAGGAASGVAKLEGELGDLSKEYEALQARQSAPGYASDLQKFKNKIAGPIAEEQGLLRSDVSKLPAEDLLALVAVSKKHSAGLASVGAFAGELSTAQAALDHLSSAGPDLSIDQIRNNLSAVRARRANMAGIIAKAKEAGTPSGAALSKLEAELASLDGQIGKWDTWLQANQLRTGAPGTQARTPPPAAEIPVIGTGHGPGSTPGVLQAAEASGPPLKSSTGQPVQEVVSKPAAPFVGQEMVSGMAEVDQAKNVKVLTDAQRAQAKLRFGADGKIYDANGNLYNTPTEVASRWAAPGSKPVHLGSMFVMDTEGNFYVAALKEGEYQHSSFLGGKPVAGAGVMVIEDGVVTYLDNESGHYTPTKSTQNQAISHLEDQLGLQRGALAEKGVVKWNERTAMGTPLVPPPVAVRKLAGSASVAAPPSPPAAPVSVFPNVSESWAIVKAKVTGVTLKVVKVGDQRRFEYVPKKYKAMPQDRFNRPDHRSDSRYVMGQGDVPYDNQNKYLEPFRRIKAAGFNEIDLENPAQRKILDDCMKEASTANVPGVDWTLENRSPAINVDSLGNVYALDRHRIEAAEQLGMPIIVSVSAAKSFN